MNRHTRILLRIRESARRNGGRFTSTAQAAIYEFHRMMEASSEGPSRSLVPKATEDSMGVFPIRGRPGYGRSDEDERRVRRCTGEGRHRVRADEDDAFCPKCGARMQDEDEVRADEDEGDRSDRDSVKNRQDEENPLGYTGWKGEDRKPIVVKSGRGAEAASAFRREYQALKESKSFSADRAVSAIVRTGF